MKAQKSKVDGKINATHHIEQQEIKCLDPGKDTTNVLRRVTREVCRPKRNTERRALEQFHPAMATLAQQERSKSSWADDIKRHSRLSWMQTDQNKGRWRTKGG